jgi:Glycosyltransferase Family 4
MSQPNTVLPKVHLEVVRPRLALRDEPASARTRFQSKASLPSRIAVMGNYLPRHCGIATFTTDLCTAIAMECGSAQLMALPVNDTEEGYDYPNRVRWSLAQDDVKSYRDAAEFLNFNNIDMVCLQHEYGIFGGPAGSHILHLLRGLRMPVVTTLHTVLREPNPDQRLVMEEIAELSDRLVVTSQLSSQFLQEIFKVPGNKIDMVPHGVPDLPFLDPNFYKDRFGVERESGSPHVRTALPEQGNRKRNSGFAADSVQAQERCVHRRRRDSSSYPASRGR